MLYWETVIVITLTAATVSLFCKAVGSLYTHCTRALISFVVQQTDPGTQKPSGKQIRECFPISSRAVKDTFLYALCCHSQHLAFELLSSAKKPFRPIYNVALATLQRGFWSPLFYFIS